MCHTLLGQETALEVWIHEPRGPDGLLNRLLRVLAFELNEPLCVTWSIVCSVRRLRQHRGNVPQLGLYLKPTHEPVYMHGQTTTGVCLSPNLAKLIETFVIKSMMEDMAPNLDYRQLGNRKRKSATHHLVQLVQYAYQALKDGHAVDHSKAFNRVDITVALDRLLESVVRHQLLR